MALLRLLDVNGQHRTDQGRMVQAVAVSAARQRLTPAASWQGRPKSQFRAYLGFHPIVNLCRCSPEPAEQDQQRRKRWGSLRLSRPRLNLATSRCQIVPGLLIRPWGAATRAVAQDFRIGPCGPKRAQCTIPCRLGARQMARAALSGAITQPGKRAAAASLASSLSASADHPRSRNLSCLQGAKRIPPCQGDVRPLVLL